MPKGFDIFASNHGANCLKFVLILKVKCASESFKCIYGFNVNLGTTFFMDLA